MVSWSFKTPVVWFSFPPSPHTKASDLVSSWILFFALMLTTLPSCTFLFTIVGSYWCWQSHPQDKANQSNFFMPKALGSSHFCHQAACQRSGVRGRQGRETVVGVFDREYNNEPELTFFNNLSTSLSASYPYPPHFLSHCTINHSSSKQTTTTTNKQVILSHPCICTSSVSVLVLSDHLQLWLIYLNWNLLSCYLCGLTILMGGKCREMVRSKNIWGLGSRKHIKSDAVESVWSTICYSWGAYEGIFRCKAPGGRSEGPQLLLVQTELLCELEYGITSRERQSHRC